MKWTFYLWGAPWKKNHTPLPIIIRETHQSPAFNWGFHSKDNTQQTYGYGPNTTIGTHCNANAGANYRPGKRMNFMFTR